MNQGNWILAVVFLALSACAGRHVIPESNYASVGERTVRAAFDQNGDTYPRTTADVDWSSFRPSFSDKNFGGAFSLKEHYKQSGGKDWDAVQHRARKDVAAELNNALTDGGTLVVLIHGFNNRYFEAGKAYELMRERVKIDDKRVVFLEVFWDGLRLRNEKAISGYATFWPNALTYSNLAGNYGLRSLLNSIEKTSISGSSRILVGSRLRLPRWLIPIMTARSTVQAEILATSLQARRRASIIRISVPSRLRLSRLPSVAATWWTIWTTDWGTYLLLCWRA